MIEPLTEISRETDFKKGALLLVDKPKGITSFKVVKDIRYWVKKNYQIKEKLKVGHAGTLDPLASGLLIICTGKMTKKIPKLQEDKKVYTGTFTFGATTPSFDLETGIDKEYSTENITKEKLKAAFRMFTGKIDQIPPTYSAVKVGGRRAYDYARKKDDVELKAKNIEIYNFELISFDLPHVQFRIECSKGTYIRSLARDLGYYLHSGAYLSELRREQTGNYHVKDAFIPSSLKEIIEEVTPTAY